MANEITVSVSLNGEKGTKKDRRAFGGLQFDMAGNNFIHHTQSIGTSEEALVMSGDVTVPGWAVFFNHDDTNFVEIRPATGVADLVTVPPQGPALFKFASDATAPFAIADTATCDLEYLIFEA
jgi:hypothetical protein